MNTISNETFAQTIDRLVSVYAQNSNLSYEDRSKVYKCMKEEIHKTPTETLKGLFEEVSSRLRDGWKLGTRTPTEEVFSMIRTELHSRELIDIWDSRDKSKDKPVFLDGGIGAILTTFYPTASRPEKWAVKTPINGLAIDYGKTMKDAVKNANSTIAKHGLDFVKRLIEESDSRPWEED